MIHRKIFILILNCLNNLYRNKTRLAEFRYYYDQNRINVPNVMHDKVDIDIFVNIVSVLYVIFCTIIDPLLNYDFIIPENIHVMRHNIF